MNTQQTDTPETDAEETRMGACGINGDFARKLERERNEARNWQNVKVSKDGETHTLGTLIQLLEHERDDYRKKLQAELDVKELGFHMLRACLNLSGTHTWEELAGEVAACRKERDEARTALSGRTVSCSQCNETARQLEAMREAVKELRESLEVGKDSVETWDWCNNTLAKLQPLITP